MKSHFKRLGDYIQLVDERNDNLEVTRLLGINIKKEFMPSVANTSESDLTKYKIIRRGQFAYSAMQVGRDETVRVALFTEDEPAIISPAYLVFEVTDETKVSPEFLMMFFNRPESDRYGWFISDGSVRASLEWERFCEIGIPIPDDIEDQIKYVAIYGQLLNNQKCFENSLNDLQFVCNHSIELLRQKAGSRSIGGLINLVDERNVDLQISRLLGINVKKAFMPSIANTSETDLSKYKIIRKGQFAYSAMQVGRDENIRVALYNDDEPAIISPAYLVFEIREEKEVSPEFLMMFFNRPESDRYGWFISDGSVRASLEWERFCEIQVPTPDSEAQATIVSIYKVFERRKYLNAKLKALVRPICPILIRGVINHLSSPVIAN